MSIKLFQSSQMCHFVFVLPLLMNASCNVSVPPTAIVSLFLPGRVTPVSALNASVFLLPPPIPPTFLECRLLRQADYLVRPYLAVVLMGGVLVASL